jgi:hypothetical protein
MSVFKACDAGKAVRSNPFIQAAIARNKPEI